MPAIRTGLEEETTELQQYGDPELHVLPPRDFGLPLASGMAEAATLPAAARATTRETREL